MYTYPDLDTYKRRHSFTLYFLKWCTTSTFTTYPLFTLPIYCKLLISLQSINNNATTGALMVIQFLSLSIPKSLQVKKNSFSKQKHTSVLKLSISCGNKKAETSWSTSTVFYSVCSLWIVHVQKVTQWFGQTIALWIMMNGSGTPPARESQLPARQSQLMHRWVNLYCSCKCHM